MCGELVVARACRLAPSRGQSVQHVAPIFEAQEQLQQLHSHTARLAALLPSRWTQTCLQTYDFMDGVHSATIQTNGNEDVSSSSVCPSCARQRASLSTSSR